MNALIQLVRFSRPHTIVGTTLSIVALYLLALAYAEPPSGSTALLLITLVSCLGANLFIVGLNQLTDVEIDRINKPYLPLASGAFSIHTGRWLIFSGLAISLLLAVYAGKYLLLTVVLSLLLGTAYSLPPIRLKRFYFWAAFCIITVRGLIVNLLLFLHFHWLLNGTQRVPILVWWLTAAIFTYGLVIAWFKDMPDTEGDRAYSINTLSLRLGVEAVFRIGNILLIGLFLLLVGLPFWTEIPVNEALFSFGHALMLGLLLWSIRRVDLAQQASIARYYQTIWLLFFAEYILFAIAAQLG